VLVLLEVVGTYFCFFSAGFKICGRIKVSNLVFGAIVRDQSSPGKNTASSRRRSS
jgi:hypothetical protein